MKDDDHSMPVHTDAIVQTFSVFFLSVFPENAWDHSIPFHLAAARSKIEIGVSLYIHNINITIIYIY